MLEFFRVEMSPDQNKLIARRRSPFFALDVKTRATELKNIAVFVFPEPENAFGSKHIFRKFLLQKLVKLFEVKRAIAFKGDRNEAIIIEVR